jgi:hypothetical protein
MSQREEWEQRIKTMLAKVGIKPASVLVSGGIVSVELGNTDKDKKSCDRIASLFAAATFKDVRVEKMTWDKDQWHVIGSV